MLFITTGTHEPFDRLVRATDDWACQRPDVQVFGQIAVRDSTTYLPRHFPWVQSMTANAYKLQVARSFLLLAHAGMGSVIAALSAHKPIVILPRRGYLHETRNDHQFATALKLQSKMGITVVLSEAELHQKLDEAWQRRLAAEQVAQIPAFADDKLITALRNFVYSEPASKWNRRATGPAAAIDSHNLSA